MAAIENTERLGSLHRAGQVGADGEARHEIGWTLGHFAVDLVEPGSRETNRASAGGNRLACRRQNTSSIGAFKNPASGLQRSVARRRTERGRERRRDAQG